MEFSSLGVWLSFSERILSARPLRGVYLVFFPFPSRTIKNNYKSKQRFDLYNIMGTEYLSFPVFTGRCRYVFR
jgi:hypothetical protein